MSLQPNQASFHSNYPMGGHTPRSPSKVEACSCLPEASFFRILDITQTYGCQLCVLCATSCPTSPPSCWSMLPGYSGNTSQETPSALGFSLCPPKDLQSNRKGHEILFSTGLGKAICKRRKQEWGAIGEGFLELGTPALSHEGRNEVSQVT